MKKFFYIIIFFIINNSSIASSNIVYIDVQYIIDNSDIGKLYKEKIKKMRDESSIELKPKQIKIKIMEDEIKNKKNILKKEELDQKISSLNEFAVNYQKLISDINKKIASKKRFYSSEVLKILNPILTEYVDKNNIKLVIEKKNVLVGVKALDITQNILKILNEETKKKNLLNEN